MRSYGGAHALWYIHFAAIPLLCLFFCLPCLSTAIVFVVLFSSISRYLGSERMEQILLVWQVELESEEHCVTFSSPFLFLNVTIYGAVFNLSFEFC